MAIQTFTAGQVLTAAQMNNLQANDYNLSTTTQTNDYTLVVGDRGTREIANKATAITFTVPANVFTAGDIVHVHNIGAGVLTLAAGAGMTLTTAQTSLTVPQWQGGTIFFTSATASIFFPFQSTNRTKIIYSTRAMTAATGSVSYTGAGFRPSYVLGYGVVDFSVMSHGFADSARTAYNITNPSGSGSQSYLYTSFLYIETGAGTSQSASISSYDADGLTLSWTKAGAPTGTAGLAFLCIE